MSAKNEKQPPPLIEEDDVKAKSEEENSDSDYNPEVAEFPGDESDGEDCCWLFTVVENVEVLVLLSSSCVLVNLTVNYELASLACPCKYSASTYNTKSSSMSCRWS